MGDYFSQTSIIYFCLEFGCCPYYRGILKARADCTYFGRGKREAFKQDMFIWMHLLLSSRGGGGGGGGGGVPYYGLYKETLPKGQVSFSDLRYFNP